MNIQTLLGSDAFYLAEGISFFKNSKRLSKLAEKMERNLTYVKDDREREEITEYISNLRAAATEFSNIESKYSVGNKVEAKAEYDKLKIRYFKLVKDINTETMKKFLLIAGAYVGLSLLLSAIPSGAVKGVDSQQPPSLDFIRREIAANNSKLASIKNSTKQLSVMEKNMELMSKLQKEMARVQKKIS